VCAEDAEFGIPEVESGIFAILNLPEPLYQTFPPAIALELLLLGKRISARRAYEIGFVNRIVRAEDVMETAIGIARQLCSNSQVALRKHKEIFYKSRAMNRQQLAELNWKFQSEVLELERGKKESKTDLKG
jgi:enoyl-CoA hydratase/carnithine racemase